jgi:enamine deaminase RidA (YjgF/YER057c/UK114 family)
VSGVRRFRPSTRVGDLVFVSGQVPRREGKLLAVGRVGADVSLALAQECARQCARHVLEVVESEYGSLDAVSLAKLTVFVASDPTFVEQPAVADCASDVFLEALGARGEHARSAVGVAALPLGAPVEVRRSSR